MLASNARDLLLVDDEPGFRGMVAKHFRRHGYRVAEVSDGEHALRLASKRAFKVAAVDTVLPGMSGIEVLKQLKAGSACQVIVLTGSGTIENAVEAMKLGAYDYLSKPVRLPEFQTVVDSACQRGATRTEQRQRPAAERPANMIGESPAMLELYRLIERAGPSHSPILIQGESGTGKELVARALHRASACVNEPFVAVNCAALSETLLESELFGHERGAFTGATTTKRGLFEAADGGTLFIDEVGEMPLGLQAKLLRIIEDGSLRRVGAVEERHVHVRLLTASNRRLGEEVRARRFREDLYYRINVMNLTLPPLRERDSDISLLARHFAGREWKIDDDAMRAICSYNWPGNVRQLINALERAKILADDHIVLVANLPTDVAKCTRSGRRCVDRSSLNLDTIKRQHVEFVLTREKGNKVRAARALGVSRRSLYRLLDEYKIALR